MANKVLKAIRDAIKVHSGHMKHPDKVPSKASAAREMRDMKRAERAARQPLTVGGAVKKRKTAMSQWQGFSK